MSRPTGLIASKGIELLTWSTPNGYKASILLEELKAAYPSSVDYTSQGIDIGKDVQKEPWFTALNPNGRIPAIVDHNNNGLAVFEGNAILSYLTRRYDIDHKLSFDINSDDYTRCESWIGWQHGGIGPMQGQANHFVLAAKESIPYPIQRYVGETQRLYGVLEARLSGRDYVVGPDRGKYSIADISMLGWVNISHRVGIDLPSKFPNISAWLRRCYERPAVRKGFAVPKEPASSQLAEPTEEQKKQNAAIKVKVDSALEQYGYKYKSP